MEPQRLDEIGEVRAKLLDEAAALVKAAGPCGHTFAETLASAAMLGTARLYVTLRELRKEFPALCCA